MLSADPDNVFELLILNSKAVFALILISNINLYYFQAAFI